MELYSIKNLSFSYEEQENKILKNINLDIKKGEFVVLAGLSGSGKTSLLRQLKPVLALNGKKEGEIYFENQNIDKLDPLIQASKIGFVMQDIDSQIVTDKVWHELSFGLESLGYDSQTIRLKVAEMASFFGIQNWFYKKTTELSGGQKQLLNLASIMTMQPSVLILDEPTSQLDPIVASDFLKTINRINKELGTTIILTEHRLEESLEYADRLIVMEDGEIIADDSPKKVGKKLKDIDNNMFLAMPVPMRVYMGVDSNLECPITVREGRSWLEKYSKNKKLEIDLNKKDLEDKEDIIKVDQVYFKYEKNSDDIVKDLSFTVKKEELFTILGGNGTGKTTSLSLIAGINKAYRGNIYINNTNIDKISYEERYNNLLGVLPQNPQSLFIKSTVELDLYEVLENKDISDREKDLKVAQVIELCNLDKLLNSHPYDLSGGEMQRLALAKVLLLEPKILLLDEPTKGLDASFKRHFAKIIDILKDKGVSILMVSHDIEFAASYSDRCALFFNGSIVSMAETREFFTGNTFYTTSANRMSRDKIDNILTAEELIIACGGKVKKEEDIKIDKDFINKKIKNKEKLDKEVVKNKKENIIKKIISFLFMTFSFLKMYPKLSDFTWSKYLNSKSLVSLKEVGLYLSLFLFSLVLFLKTVFKSDRRKSAYIGEEIKKEKLDKKTKISIALILLLIPLTLFIGNYYLKNRKYYFISILILLEIMIPFFMVFENRKPKARELVLIAVLSSIAIAGRAIFFMLPQFKPIAAITIVSGVALGAETGFLVGASTMILSNTMHGQGPWTPWQMFAMGSIGFFAGLLFKKGLLRRDKISLAIFGSLAVFFIYGGIMNPASVLIYQEVVTLPMIITAYITGIPYDLVHGFATFIFLYSFGEGFLEKLDRIKVKYGLIG